ncbi:hypothetical protein [Nioella sediminis]|jgi:hypothetical protein|uniref:hypothetical protein n=1 Tax=Nioella sediminis TaxID=1912092 RepID=UPI0008FD906A|nr:hypothetical protein [Nioella sediminis]TBX16178.1 hypothetical protein TK43_17845 [Roseovarius sp. JS7-11]
MASKSELIIPFDDFFQADRKPAEFANMLGDCFARRGSLGVECRKDAFRVSLRASSNLGSGVKVAGNWRGPDFESTDFSHAGTKLFLPFLFEISEINLSHAQIFTLGHSYRSLADFFMRNLLLSLCRDEALDIDGSGQEIVDDGVVRNFQRQYFYIFKTLFPEPVLEKRHARESIDFMQANAYVPVMDFQNPLLRLGAEQLRATCLSRSGQKSQEQLLKGLHQARQKMMAHFSK